MNGERLILVLLALGTAGSINAQEFGPGNVPRIVRDLNRAGNEVSYVDEFGLSTFGRDADVYHLRIHKVRNLEILAERAYSVPGLRVVTINAEFPLDIEPLAGLTQLQTLDIRMTGVDDLSPLANLTDLRSLDLSGCPFVEELTPLGRLTKLENLNLEGTIVKDLSPIANLKSLRRLRLSSSIDDLSPISELENLESLVYWGSALDLSPISELDSLKDLELRHGGEDLDQIGKIASLERLIFDRLSGLHDLTPLHNLTNLKLLRLGSLYLEDDEDVIELQNALPECTILFD